MTPSFTLSCERCTRLFTTYEWDENDNTSGLCVGCLAGVTFFNLDTAKLRAERVRQDAAELARAFDAAGVHDEPPEGF